jgi:hypothetical protein
VITITFISLMQPSNSVRLRESRNIAGTKTAYKDFLALWKDGDNIRE